MITLQSKACCLHSQLLNNRHACSVSQCLGRFHEKVPAHSMLPFSRVCILRLKTAELCHIPCPFDLIPLFLGALRCWQGAPVCLARGSAFAHLCSAAPHAVCSAFSRRQCCLLQNSATAFRELCCTGHLSSTSAVQGCWNVLLPLELQK